MAILKCKMCGGTVEFENGATVGVCDSCGTKQTLPRLDDDRKANLYDRANHFRRNNEYDKAMSIYEQILNEDSTDAESYWSILLCKYGIEYVEDPSTHKRVPTVNRAQFTSVVADEDYKKAIEYADIEQKIIYEDEAKTIDEIQKGILEVSQKEEPFDVFICYKETDNTGRRTHDSVLANDLYHQLVQEGFKVFFSRITLEDKLGTAYEPYIFAALNSSKVMVVLGTKPEYFNAVWVKNEWSRYLALIKSGAKKMLIPAYKDMDPYDLPEEFSHLQAQDMSRLGFMQDLIRGIKKIVGEDQPQVVASPVSFVTTGSFGTNVSALLKRGNMALEDSDWEKANDFFEDVLNNDPECAEAYMGQFLAEHEQSSFESFVHQCINESESVRSEKINIAPKDDLSHIQAVVNENVIPDYLSVSDIENVYRFDWSIDSCVKGRKAQKKSILDTIVADKKLVRAVQYAGVDYKASIEKSIAKLESELDERIRIAEVDDADKRQNLYSEYSYFLNKQDNVVREMHTSAIRYREESKSRATDKSKKNSKLRIVLSLTSVVLCLAVVFVSVFYLLPAYKYDKAVNLMQSGDYSSAKTILADLDGFRDSEMLLSECNVKLNVDNIQVGDVFECGEYNGASLEWVVLDRSDNRFLVLCNKAIGNCEYNDRGSVLGWSSSNLRKTLNSFYLFQMFSDEAKKHIIPCGDQDDDLLFVLSEDEIEKYSSVIEQHPVGANWWVKDDGLGGTALVYRENTGDINSIAQEVGCPVRPAMWIDLESYLFCAFNSEDGSYQNLANVDIGFRFEFGSYDSMPIEWIVLDVTDKGVLVISSDIICSNVMNDSSHESSWEDSVLMQWLNTEFYLNAFTAEERRDYLSRVNDNDLYQVSLLDSEQAEMYMGVIETSSACNESWWLCDQPRGQRNTSYYVSEDCIIDSSSQVYVRGVRPVMIFNLDLYQTVYG